MFSWQEEDAPYNIFLFTLGFFIPLLIILVTSIEVIIKLKRDTRNIINRDIRMVAEQRQEKVMKMVRISKY